MIFTTAANPLTNGMIPMISTEIASNESGTVKLSINVLLDISTTTSEYIVDGVLKTRYFGKLETALEYYNDCVKELEYAAACVDYTERAE